MNRISLKLLSVLAIFLFIAVIPIAVFATNEDVSIVGKVNSELEQEYIIYIKDYTDKTFKYAFTNIENADPNSMDLSFIISRSDLSESKNQAAFLDATTYEKLSKNNETIYMWVKDELDNFVLEGIQLKLNEALTEENVVNVETITNRINVEIADSEEDATTIRNENVEGVEETASVGYVKILDDKKSTYYYERVKLPSSEEYNQLMKLAEQIKEEYDEMNMYEKVKIGTEFNKLYSKITSEVKWQEVEDMMIEQPEESVAGDKYIVLLKKVDKQGVETIDVQFLTAFDSYVPNLVKEQIVTQETTKLPITYDSIALFVILGIIIILVVAVLIRMKKISKQNEEK